MFDRAVAGFATGLILVVAAGPALAGTFGGFGDGSVRNVVPNAVPEPATITVFGAAFAGAFLARKFLGRKYRVAWKQMGRSFPRPSSRILSRRSEIRLVRARHIRVLARIPLDVFGAGQFVPVGGARCDVAVRHRRGPRHR